MSNKQARIFVTVKDDDLLELIRTEIKNVLRNDKLIRELVAEEISPAMEQHVNIAMAGQDLPKIATSIMERRIARAIPSDRMIAGSTLKAINEKVTALIENDRAAIEKAVREDIAEPKCSVCHIEVAGVSGICKKCEIFLYQG